MDRRTKVAVVVGSGVAGATCAAECAALTAENSEADVEVVLLSPSPVVRVATAGALRCEVEVSSEPAEAWARAAGVRVLKGEATSLNARSVALRGGGHLAFDVCCLATGARPEVPKVFAGLSSDLRDRVLEVRDSNSVDFLKKAVSGSRCVVVVGNGGIALELVHEIVGCRVVWIIRDNFVGHSFFDSSVGDAMLEFLRQSGENGSIKASPVAAEQGAARSRQGNCTLDERLTPAPGKETDAPLENHRYENGSRRILGSGAGPQWLGRKEKPILFGDSNNVAEITEACQGICEARMENLDIIRNCHVTSCTSTGNAEMLPVKLALSNGSSVTCDHVICATGVVPNVEWLGGQSRVPVGCEPSPNANRESSVDVSGGVLVDASSMRSIGRKDVFAAGDCATIIRGPEMGADRGNNWFQMRLWTQAAATGRIAASAMASALCPGVELGRGLEFDLFAHATRFFGVKVVLLGRYNAQGLREGYRTVSGGDETHFIRVVLENGKVRGAVLIGDVDLSETYENLILDRLDVSHIAPEELVDPQIDLEDYFD